MPESTKTENYVLLNASDSQKGGSTDMANGLFGGGDGTELSPYLVEDAQDLWAVRGNPSAHYKQIYNIDLNVFNEDGGWTPIGTPEVPLTGVYDGSEFEIRNLWVAGKEYASLFGRVNNAKIKNIFLLNALIISATTDGMGGLVGIAENMAEDSIYNCHVRGTINESFSTQNQMGGVVGNCSSLTFAINKCSFVGDICVSGGSKRIGGVAGSCNSSIRNSYSSGRIIEASEGDWPAYIGGLIGELREGKECQYSYSIMDADTARCIYVGGLVGKTFESVVLKCWARGNVKGYNCVGGLVGDVKGTVSGCYSAGKVEGSTNIGGLAGNITSGSVLNSVWDIEASGQATSSGGIGKTTAEMKDMQTYIDLGWSI